MLICGHNLFGHLDGISPALSQTHTRQSANCESWIKHKVSSGPFDELIVKILGGLSPEFHEIFAAIRIRAYAKSYEELYEKLINHELFLKYEESNKERPPITAATTVCPKPNNLNSHINRRSNNNFSPRIVYKQFWHQFNSFSIVQQTGSYN